MVPKSEISTETKDGPVGEHSVEKKITPPTEISTETKHGSNKWAFKWNGT